MSRQFCEAQQCPRLLQPLPAVHQNECGDNSKPDGLKPQGEEDKAGHAEEADDRGRHQAAGASHDKPEQGPKNLAAIQRIDWEHVENQQAQIYQCD